MVLLPQPFSKGRLPHYLRTMRRDQRIHFILALERARQSAAIARHPEFLAAPAKADIDRTIALPIRPHRHDVVGRDREPRVVGIAGRRLAVLIAPRGSRHDERRLSNSISLLFNSTRSLHQS